MRKQLWMLGGALVAAGCSLPATIISNVGDSASISTTERMAAGRVEDGAALNVEFRQKSRSIQALSGTYYEVRAIYTEAVVRSNALI